MKLTNEENIAVVRTALELLRQSVPSNEEFSIEQASTWFESLVSSDIYSTVLRGAAPRHGG